MRGVAVTTSSDCMQTQASCCTCGCHAQGAEAGQSAVACSVPVVQAEWARGCLLTTQLTASAQSGGSGVTCGGVRAGVCRICATSSGAWFTCPPAADRFAGPRVPAGHLQSACNGLLLCYVCCLCEGEPGVCVVCIAYKLGCGCATGSSLEACCRAVGGSAPQHTPRVVRGAKPCMVGSDMPWQEIDHASMAVTLRHLSVLPHLVWAVHGMMCHSV
jgi:hypothetical protein